MTALAHRRADAEDHRFIVSSWIDSYGDAVHRGFIARPAWRGEWRRAASAILARPRVEVVVAYHPGEEERGSDLYGWIAVERGHRLPYVVYVYTKHSFRRLGVARGLLAAVGVHRDDDFMYAFHTPGVARAPSLVSCAEYEPDLIRRPEATKAKHAEATAAAA